MSTICFNCFSRTAPHYLSDLLQPYTPARQLQSAFDTQTLVTPCENTKTCGERLFSYAGPSVWNNLPQNLKTPSRRTCSITISKLSFPWPCPSPPAPSDVCVCVCVCVCVIVKCPVLPPCVVDGRSRNLFYYYY